MRTSDFRQYHRRKKVRREISILASFTAMKIVEPEKSV